MSPKYLKLISRQLDRINVANTYNGNIIYVGLKSGYEGPCDHPDGNNQ